MRVVNLIRVPARVERRLVTMPVTMRTPITPTFWHHAEPPGRASLAPFCFTALRDQTGPGLCLWVTRFPRQSEPTSARLKAFAAFCIRPGLGLRFVPLGSVVRLVLLRTARPSFTWPNFPRFMLPEGHCRRSRFAPAQTSSVLASENPSASPARPFSPVPRPRFTAPLSVAPISPRCLLLSRNRSATPFPHATPTP